jgi:DNA-binding CsgD family transcriptional regulator
MEIDPDTRLSEYAARDYLTALAARRRGAGGEPEPTSFLMDPELVVRAAEGESILRLPWFDRELFVGRQLPDIAEMPLNVRSPAVDHYRAALGGDRGNFSFVSYGNPYTVDALPVHGEDGRVTAVLAVATPAREFPAAAAAYERTADRLMRSAAQAAQRAERLSGSARSAEQERAERWSGAAERARAQARRLREGGAAPGAPSLTPREADVLVLASHGLTAAEIAEALYVSAGTVRTHFENVYVKLGVSDKAAAVATALRHGLID